MYREIKSFVSFAISKKLTMREKRLITHYYNEYLKLTARPFHVYRPRNKTHLKKAQKLAGHPSGFPLFKVAFIPTSGEPVKIKWTKSGMKIVGKFVTSEPLLFDPFRLVENPEAEVNRTTALAPKAKQFSIMCGEHLIPQTESRNNVPREVNRLTAKYANEDKNNFFGNWLIGLTAHEFDNQGDLADYKKDRKSNKKKLASKRRKNRKNLK